VKVAYQKTVDCQSVNSVPPSQKHGGKSGKHSKSKSFTTKIIKDALRLSRILIASVQGWGVGNERHPLGRVALGGVRHVLSLASNCHSVLIELDLHACHMLELLKVRIDICGELRSAEARDDFLIPPRTSLESLFALPALNRTLEQSTNIRSLDDVDFVAMAFVYEV
jgi:hypothetical protein